MLEQNVILKDYALRRSNSSRFNYLVYRKLWNICTVCYVWSLKKAREKVKPRYKSQRVYKFLVSRAKFVIGIESKSAKTNEEYAN
jgi:hypothetical protein